MASLGDLFSSRSAVGQLFLYGVLGAVLNALLTPELQELTQLSYGILPNVPLTPDQAAAAVVRGHLSESDGKDEAQKSGTDAGRFATMTALAAVHLSPADLATMVVRNILTESDAVTVAKLSGLQPDDFAKLVQATGQPPGPQTLAEGARRGIIPWDGTGPGVVSFQQGLAEGDTKDKYADLLRALAVQLPSGAEVLDALLKGVLPEQDARKRWDASGADPTWFDVAKYANGSAPTPTQLADMANRGIIPWDGQGPGKATFVQGFLEGPWRNEWLEPFKQTAVYVTPPRSVVAMVRNGALSLADATAELRKSGLDDAMIAAYLHEAQQQSGQSQRDLTMSQTISLYEAQVIAQHDAQTLLEALGYDPHNAGYLLQLADLRREIAAVNFAVGRVQSLYVGHKIDHAAAVQALHTLGLPAAQVTAVVATWDIAAAANVKLLTASEVGRAVKAQYLSAADGIAELVAQGYSTADAWIVLSLTAGAPQPNPPAGVTAPQSAGP